MTWRHAAEAAEIDRTHWWKLERGLLLPQLNLLVKIAATINLRCDLLTTGIRWSPQETEFAIDADAVEGSSAHERMGLNALDARRCLGAFQQTIAERADDRMRAGAASGAHGPRLQLGSAAGFQPSRLNRSVVVEFLHQRMGHHAYKIEARGSICSHGLVTHGLCEANGSQAFGLRELRCTARWWMTPSTWLWNHICQFLMLHWQG